MSFFFDLIITPLVFIYELVFYVCCNYLSSHFESLKDYLLVGIIIVSLFVNVLSLPLYNAADRLQKEERAKEKSMQKIITHIKRAFRGDERFLVLNAYYNLEKYNTFYQLKTAVPLLLQIPFFTAAYIFFTNTSVFKSAPLHCIPLLTDLSKPDRLLNLYGYNINLLPVIMTIINLISSFIYTKTLSFKDKLQPILLALIFFVLLYNSPSALVIYWIFNNLFSLIKILVIACIEKNNSPIPADLPVRIDVDNSNRLAILSLLTIFILLAVFIPSNIISASPGEFTVSTPFNILKFTTIVFAGYLFWELLYYKMLPNEFRVIVASLFFAISIYLLSNHIVFLNNAGNITENLLYSDGFNRFTISDVKKDVLIILFSVLMLFLSIKHIKTSTYISTLLLLSVFAACIMNIYKIQVFQNDMDSKNNIEEIANIENNKSVKISKNGKNVIVIMLDRSCGAYFDFVISNKPELKKIYDGFTFYKNTLSCASGTLIGAPALFGGYDYIPQNSNKRKDTLLVDKHNEALTILPYNFSNNGYECIVANLPYVGYGLKEKKHPFSHMQNVMEIDLNEGVYKFLDASISEEANIYSINRNFVFYSIMKTLPVAIKGLIYNDGYYLKNGGYGRLLHTLINYYAFNNLINKLAFIDNNFNSLIMFGNELTHNHNNNVLPCDTFSPYELERVNKVSQFPVKNNSDDESFIGDYAHLSTEIAAYLQIGKMLDYLKENDVYDNTRIIITSDHGTTYNHSVDNKYYFKLENGNYVTADNFNPTFLYKDFDSHGSLTISNDFMSNADVTHMSMNSLINNPVNPYINKTITSNNKNVTEIDMYWNSKGWNAADYINDYLFTNYVISCYTTDIFDKKSWFVKGDEND